jgi:hypothetical protein
VADKTLARFIVSAGYTVKNGALVELPSPLTGAKAEKEIDKIRKALSRA